MNKKEISISYIFGRKALLDPWKDCLKVQWS